VPEPELLLEPEPPSELPPQAANTVNASMAPAFNRNFMVSSKSFLKAVPSLVPGDVSDFSTRAAGL